MKTLLVLMLCSTTALGSLKWENKSVEFSAHPLQGVQPVVYRFSNDGKEPIAITDVVASCGCLVPKVDKTPIPPGGKGELKVDFDLFNRTGRQYKKLTVKTTDGKTMTLTATANIPQAYRVSPTLMQFTSSTASSKTATLKNSFGKPLLIRSVESSNPQIKAELKCIKEGQEYIVTVTPQESALTERAVIRIIPETPDGLKKVKTFKFYVMAKAHGSFGPK